MKHVGRLQVLTRTLRDVNGDEVAAVPLELRATVTQKLGEEEQGLDYEIAVEQELGFLKGVGATFNSKELVLDAWKSRAVSREIGLGLELGLRLGLGVGVGVWASAPNTNPYPNFNQVSRDHERVMTAAVAFPYERRGEP